MKTRLPLFLGALLLASQVDAQPEPNRPIRRVVVAPDKFKGTLTATEVARAMARGFEVLSPGPR
jgi:hypothetical protein